MPAMRGAFWTLATAFLLLVVFPGRVPASVEEQRRRLPPPAKCDDPVEGEWRSHQYNPMYRDWSQFTLTVRRKAPGSKELTGTIKNRFWTGTPSEVQPPPCRPGLRHYVVSMPAYGTIEGHRIFFGSRTWQIEQRLCGGMFGYNPDNFTGVIDPAIQEFQSVNNDGGRAVNEPTVFRRVSCFEPPPKPHVVVAPPPFWPVREAAGCGF
jgi:hypothetical protein